MLHCHSVLNFQAIIMGRKLSRYITPSVEDNLSYLTRKHQGLEGSVCYQHAEVLLKYSRAKPSRGESLHNLLHELPTSVAPD